MGMQKRAPSAQLKAGGKHCTIGIQQHALIEHCCACCCLLPPGTSLLVGSYCISSNLQDLGQTQRVENKQPWLSLLLLLLLLLQQW